MNKYPDTSEEFLVEISIKDLPHNASSIMLTGKVSQKSDIPRDSLIYAVMRTEHHLDPVGTLKYLATYRQPEKIEQLIWRLADMCSPARYWMLAFYTDEPPVKLLSQSGRVAREVRLENSEWVDEVAGGHLLVNLPLNAKLHLSEWSGTGHTPGFHFIAVQSDSESDTSLEELYLSPRQRPGMISSLIWDDSLLLYDSLFEIKPFGNENRDNVQIVLPPGLTRERTREILIDIYQLPYFTTEMTLAEYYKWENDGELDDLELQQL